MERKRERVYSKAAIASAKTLGYIENKKTEAQPQSRSNETEANLYTVFPNKVFHPWYKRYDTVLNNDEQIKYQPLREIQGRNEEIAMRHQFGQEYIDNPNAECWTEYVRKRALFKYEMFREKCEQRDEQMFKTRTIMTQHLARTPAKDAVPSVKAILAARKGATDRKLDESKVLVREELIVLNGVIAFLNRLRRQDRIENIQKMLKKKGWDIKKSKWSILQREKAKVYFKKEYAKLHKVEIRTKFRRTIRLVHAAMRFLHTVGEISGDTMTFFKETFTMQEKIKEDIANAQKFLFDPHKFKISNETVLDSATLYTLTLPFFTRTEEDINHVIKSLQVLRSFAELPSNTQKHVATVAWYIKIPENKMIIRQCHESKNAYILLSGKAIKNVFEGDPVDYGADHYQKGGFRVLQNFLKDSMFGEEALQNPGSTRTYSVLTGNVKCEALSISVDDYWEITMNPPMREFEDRKAHEIIRFLSNCAFFYTFPTGRFIDDTEDNVFVAYFRPGSVVEKSVRDSSWMYVIKHGTCRSMIEIKPLPELVSAYKINRISSGEDEPKLDMLLPSRMVPIPDVLAAKEDIPSDIDEGHTSKRRKSRSIVRMLTNLEETETEPTSNIRNREDEADDSGVIAQEIYEVRRKADILQRRLDRVAKRKREKEEAKKRVQEEEEEEARLKAEEEKLDRFNKKSPEEVNHSDSESTSLLNMDDIFPMPEKEQNKYTLKAITKFCMIAKGAKEPRKTKALSFDLEESVDLQQEITNDKTSDDEKCKKSIKVKGKSQQSPDFSQAPSKHISNPLPKRHMSLKSIPEQIQTADDGKPKWSTWKLKKQMVKGDQGGLEWVNLFDGNYRPPEEDYSIVSNGAEVVLIRKEFIIKHMRVKQKEITIEKVHTTNSDETSHN